MLCRWGEMLQPILLSNMYGKLDFLITAPLFVELIRQRVTSVADISWNRLIELWPFQTIKSLKRIVLNASRDKRAEHKTVLHQKLKVLFEFYKRKKITPTARGFRENIVGLYNSEMCEKR